MATNKRDNIIQAYFSLNIGLVRSIIIKSDYAETAINRQIVRDNGADSVDYSDPTSWKYYMNLAGEYHPLDTPMYVISLDTRENILFSKENLVRHTATAEAYQMGSRYYYGLLREFPNQESLIRGVLYPADKAKAIAAKEGSILAYRPSLVEENETTLIIELEDYVKRMMGRWYVSAYALTDEYYPAVFFSGLAGMILLQLLQLRSDRRKTAEVHSFHLREYLASNNGLDKYLKFLWRDQALWLYRNIKYIQRNAGNSFMFDALVKEILDKRRIPLTDYTIRQLQEETNAGYPVLQARRTALTSVRTSGLDPYVSMDIFFDKEVKTAPGNERYYQVSQESMIHALRTNDSTVTRTKDLESSMIDVTDAVPDTMEDVFMRQWIYMTHAGLYDVVVNFQDPITTDERSLMSKDAIIYMAYLQFKSEGLDLTTLPPIANLKYRRHPRPLAEELQEVIPKDFRYNWLRELSHELVASQPVLTECYSVSMFYTMTFKIYEECLKHWFLQADCGDPHMRGVLESMCNTLFGVACWDFGDGENLEDWRVRNNLPPYTYTKDQANLIIKELFERATGFKIDETRQLRFIQRALVSLFQDLSSYSIQVMREINDSKVILTGTPEIRIGYEGSEGATNIFIPIDERIDNWKMSGGDNLSVTDESFPDYLEVKHGSETTVPDQIDVGLTITLDDSEIDAPVVDPGMYVSLVTKTTDPLTGETTIDPPPDSIDFNYPFEKIQKLARFLGN